MDGLKGDMVEMGFGWKEINKFRLYETEEVKDWMNDLSPPFPPTYALITLHKVSQ